MSAVPVQRASSPRMAHGWRDDDSIRPAQSGRVLIVSNRLPITVDTEGGRPVLRRSVGGLATGLHRPHERTGGLWFGWPGSLDELTAEDSRDLFARLESDRTVPVPLTQGEVEMFYEGYSNAVLWPICHDRLDRLPLRIDGWDVYEQVNARFADIVAEYWRPGDLIWVHDYHLMRAPALLRERLPEARIGFFLHVPFPSPDIFAALPQRRALVEGLLGADVIGFHTRRYRDHFVEALAEFRGAAVAAGDDVPVDAAVDPADDAMVEAPDGRRVRVGVFPIGVDAAGFAARAGSREVSARALDLRTGAQRLLLGIDRLDYSKGIPRRLLALERLLTAHPEWRGRVKMLQVAVPSRGGVGAYQQFRQEVESLVGRINGEFTTPSWTPIHYLHDAVSEETLLALYRAADVMMVTPVRDGMNLVAKEFVASRSDEDGVLVLSEFAGAADELDDAIVVNPYDVDQVADQMHRALTMPRGERRARMHRLRERVLAHDVDGWVAGFIEALSAARR